MASRCVGRGATLRDMLGTLRALLCLSLSRDLCVSHMAEKIPPSYVIQRISSPSKLFRKKFSRHLPLNLSKRKTHGSLPPSSHLFIRFQSLAVAQQRKNLCTIFTSVRKIAESNYQLHHVCLLVRPPVRPSARPHRTTGLPLDDFHEI